MVYINPMKEAAYYTVEDGYYVCGLCPHACRIGVGEYGICSSRYGTDEKLTAYTYGKLSSICVDPIEKKPLYHFHPGSRTFSVGSVGCNMRCRHCQNYTISQYSTGKKRTTYVSPERLVDMSKKDGSEIISFTYNEPTMWFEYIRDVMSLDHELKCVMVTNGLINEEPLREISKIVSAMNIDVKAFTDKFYMKICGAHLEDVLKSVKIAFEEGVHIELTYLMIPEWNDSPEEIKKFAEWVCNELSSDVPIHFSRFHPDYDMNDIQWTAPESLIEARNIAMEAGLNYVYTGNIVSEGTGDTYCPNCEAVAVSRLGYRVEIKNMEKNKCASCGHDLNMIV